MEFGFLLINRGGSLLRRYMTEETYMLGEDLGPCPCCNRLTKLKTYTPGAKGLQRALKGAHPLLLKLDPKSDDTVYVDRAGHAWGFNKDTEKYKPLGFVHKLIAVKPPTVSVRKKKVTVKTKRLKKTKDMKED